MTIRTNTLDFTSVHRNGELRVNVFNFNYVKYIQTNNHVVNYRSSLTNRANNCTGQWRIKK